MDKNYRRVWLRPLRKDKCAGQGYVATGKVHSFFAGPAFLRPLDQSTLSAGYSRKDDEKDEASERSSRAPRGTQTKECSTS
jgi:hypothetical protein